MYYYTNHGGAVWTRKGSVAHILNLCHKALRAAWATRRRSDVTKAELQRMWMLLCSLLKQQIFQAPQIIEACSRCKLLPFIVPVCSLNRSQSQGMCIPTAELITLTLRRRAASVTCVSPHFQPCRFHSHEIPYNQLTCLSFLFSYIHFIAFFFDPG